MISGAGLQEVRGFSTLPGFRFSYWWGWAILAGAIVIPGIISGGLHFLIFPKAFQWREKSASAGVTHRSTGSKGLPFACFCRILI